MRITTTNFYCDRCGKELREVPIMYHTTHPDTSIKVLREEWNNADLCEECINSFKFWWEGLTTIQKEPEPEKRCEDCKHYDLFSHECSLFISRKE